MARNKTGAGNTPAEVETPKGATPRAPVLERKRLTSPRGGNRVGRGEAGLRRRATRDDALSQAEAPEGTPPNRCRRSGGSTRGNGTQGRVSACLPLRVDDRWCYTRATGGAGGTRANRVSGRAPEDLPEGKPRDKGATKTLR